MTSELNKRFTHSDGRVCRCLPYALDGMEGLLEGYFYGDPPVMRRCHREHGLQGAEDERDGADTAAD